MSNQKDKSGILITYTASIQKQVKHLVDNDTLDAAIKEAIKDGAINAREDFFQEDLIHAYLDLDNTDEIVMKYMEDGVEIQRIDEDK